jgi:hypothetical protein
MTQGCGTCVKIRGYMPAAIRARLETVEARLRAQRQAAVAIKTVTPPSVKPTPPAEKP